MNMRRNDIFHSILKILVTSFVAGFLVSWSAAFGQNRQLVQVKTFDEKLNPLSGVEISVNEKPFLLLNSKGVAFIELSESDLPVKTIVVKDETLEAASWNYSKGTLEVIVRKKSYRIVPIFIRDAASKPVPGVLVAFGGLKELRLRTDQSGKVELLLAVNEPISNADQFRIDKYRILRLVLSTNENTLYVEPIVAPPIAHADESASEIASTYFVDFDLSKIDSIRSLTAFYAIFKNYSVSDLNPDVKRRLDEKLNELVQELQDSLARGKAEFASRISDSSFVGDDIRSMIEQAQVEGAILDDQRRETEERIRLISEKIAAAGENMDEATRTILLSDLTRLEQLLAENESRFYKNQSDFRSILAALKEEFFHVEVLENKLSQSEAQRRAEQRIFRKRLLTTIAIASAFALMALLLVYFGLKLRRRKKQLEVANFEVKRINENLESLVHERTKLLVETNRELDLFLYKASHDLRSPVTSIIGLCSIAAYVANGNNDARELFEKAGQTAHAMDRLLKKLRIISEINQPGHFTSIDIHAMIETVRSRFNSFIEGHKVDFQLKCPTDLSFYCNATLTEAIVQALVENALFYSVLGKRSPRVEVSATLTDNALQIGVLDNGIGIGDDIRGHIFDMFFIGHEQSRGNGLGLYIVEKSVQALKGTIELDTIVGSHARFLITIPLRSAVRGVEQQAVSIPLPERRVLAEIPTK